MSDIQQAEQKLKELIHESPNGLQQGGLSCPFCDGGQDKEGTFSLCVDQGRAYYKCHRASCGESGVTSSTSRSLQLTPKMSLIIAGYKGELIALPDVVMKQLKDKWDIDEWHIKKGGWLWATHERRVFMPVFDINNYKIGQVLRSLKAGVKPKTLTTLYNVRGVPTPLSLYKGPDNTRVIVIVEDIPSAVRVSKFVNAAALLGTNITEEKINAIKEMGATTAVIALDRDAVSTAAVAMPKFSSRFKITRLISHNMTKDLKDCTDDEIQDLISDII